MMSGLKQNGAIEPTSQEVDHPLVRPIILILLDVLLEVLYLMLSA